VADGAIQEFTSPNFNNNKYHVDYNSRLQPTEIWAGSAPGANALFDKQYQYNAPNTSQMNNGNIYTVTNVKDGTRTQTFGYDALNRLISAGDQSHWANTYTYDPWGNLTNKNPGTPAGETLQKSADSNNHLSGIGYDAGGNETNDGLGNTFVYDAENRITTTAGVSYTYDADGRRISKSTGINYWYGPTGAALAETDSSGNWTNYIFFGGQRLARNVGGDIKYYITDHLHSTAMFVDKAGTQAAILDDNDFYPWGGVVSGVGKTTSNNTVKFSGQYRDTESQMDYFGSRYYANITGRFMSPDWAGKPTSVPYAEFGDPQSLNLYSYVRNSPIVRVDAGGHATLPSDEFMAPPARPGYTWGTAGKCEEELCTETEKELERSFWLGGDKVNFNYDANNPTSDVSVSITHYVNDLKDNGDGTKTLTVGTVTTAVTDTQSGPVYTQSVDLRTVKVEMSTSRMWTSGQHETKAISLKQAEKAFSLGLGTDAGARTLATLRGQARLEHMAAFGQRQNEQIRQKLERTNSNDFLHVIVEVIKELTHVVK
jgi:RHS repeat-associated protein